MSDPHAAEIIADGPHGATDHGDEPGHEHDDHAHLGQALGPIDWPAYGAGAVGIVVGVLMAAVFGLTTGLL
jgi:hypothetical protein